MPRSAIRETRRLKLKEFIKTFEGGPKAKNKAAAKAIDVQPSYLSQLVMGYDPETKRGRDITYKKARQYEKNAGLQYRYFDDFKIDLDLDGLTEEDIESAAEYLELLRSRRRERSRK